MPHRPTQSAVLAPSAARARLLQALAALALVTSASRAQAQTVPGDVPAIRLSVGDVLTYRIRNHVEHRLDGRDRDDKAFSKNAGYHRTTAFDLRLTVGRGQSPQSWTLIGEITRVQAEFLPSGAKEALVVDSADEAKIAELPGSVPGRVWATSLQPLLSLVGRKLNLTIDSDGTLSYLDGLQLCSEGVDANNALDHLSQVVLGSNWSSGSWKQQFAAMLLGGVPARSQRRLGSTWTRDWLIAPTTPNLTLAPAARPQVEKPPELFTAMQPKGPAFRPVEAAPEPWLCHGEMLLAESTDEADVVFVTGGWTEQPSRRRDRDEERRQRRRDASRLRQQQIDVWNDLNESLGIPRIPGDPGPSVVPWDGEANRQLVLGDWTKSALGQNQWLDRLELQPDPACVYRIDGMMMQLSPAVRTRRYSAPPVGADGWRRWSPADLCCVKPSEARI